MGKIFKQYLPSNSIVYVCSACKSHLALSQDLISKAFHGRYGRAFLFQKAINVYKGVSEDRMLTTGMHTVCDIFCNSCEENIGWFYDHAVEESQKYKVGKFILEKGLITRIALT